MSDLPRPKLTVPPSIEKASIGTKLSVPGGFSFFDVSGDKNKRGAFNNRGKSGGLNKRGGKGQGTNKGGRGGGIGKEYGKGRVDNKPKDNGENRDHRKSKNSEIVGNSVISQENIVKTGMNSSAKSVSKKKNKSDSLLEYDLGHKKIKVDPSISSKGLEAIQAEIESVKPTLKILEGHEFKLAQRQLGVLKDHLKYLRLENGLEVIKKNIKLPKPTITFNQASNPTPIGQPIFKPIFTAQASAFHPPSEIIQPLVSLKTSSAIAAQSAIIIGEVKNDRKYAKIIATLNKGPEYIRSEINLFETKLKAVGAESPKHHQFNGLITRLKDCLSQLESGIAIENIVITETAKAKTALPAPLVVEGGFGSKNDFSNPLEPSKVNVITPFELPRAQDIIPSDPSRIGGKKNYNGQETVDGNCDLPPHIFDVPLADLPTPPMNSKPSTNLPIPSNLDLPPAKSPYDRTDELLLKPFKAYSAPTKPYDRGDIEKIGDISFHWTKHGYCSILPWHEIEQLFPPTKATVEDKFIRLNTLQERGVLEHRQFHSKEQIKKWNQGLEAEEEFISWQFEHIIDIPSIMDNFGGPILRGLYTFNNEDDIKTLSPTFCEMISHFNDRMTNVIIISPEIDPNEPNEVVIDDKNLMYHEEPLLLKMREKMTELEPDSLISGTSIIWLKKLRSIIRGYIQAKTDDPTLEIELDPVVVLTLVSKFIVASKLLYPRQSESIAKEMARVLVKVNRYQGKVLTPVAKGTMQYLFGELIRRLTNSLIFISKTRIGPRTYVIPPSLYSELIDTLRLEPADLAIVTPKQKLAYSIYSDGSITEEAYKKDLTEIGKTYFGGGTFAGILITSTQHIVAHWRFNVESFTSGSFTIELLGVCFSLLLAAKLNLPLSVRCDNYSSLELIQELFERGMQSNLVQQRIKAYPILANLLPLLLESNVPYTCRLEWVRGHSVSPPNVLVDHVTELGHLTAETLDLSEFKAAVDKVAKSAIPIILK